MKKEIAVFGGGCFWCTEAVFKMMRGVTSVVPGYAGGTVPHPTYGEVSSGTTGHAECVRIEYDPSITTYDDLLTVFFGSHDPTTRDRQGADVGTQYRSVVFYTTPLQRELVESFIARVNASSELGTPIVTEVIPLEIFYEAEDYHHDYFANNPTNPYCEVIVNPKLEKVQHQFASLLADKTKLQ